MYKSFYASSYQTLLAQRAAVYYSDID